MPRRTYDAYWRVVLLASLCLAQIAVFAIVHPVVEDSAVVAEIPRSDTHSGERLDIVSSGDESISLPLSGDGGPDWGIPTASTETCSDASSDAGSATNSDRASGICDPTFLYSSTGGSGQDARSTGIGACWMVRSVAAVGNRVWKFSHDGDGCEALKET